VKKLQPLKTSVDHGYQFAVPMVFEFFKNIDFQSSQKFSDFWSSMYFYRRGERVK